MDRESKFYCKPEVTGKYDIIFRGKFLALNPQPCPRAV